MTDRPDQTESAITVPAKSLQVETGFTFENFSENSLSVNNYSLGGTLIRYGLNNFLELRFGGAYFISEKETTAGGFGDILSGIKLNLLREEQQYLNLGLLVHAFLPVGKDAFKPEKVDPQLITAISKSLSESLTLSGNLGGSYSSTTEEMIYLYSAALGISLTELLGSFVEIYGNITPTTAPSHNFDAGFTYLLSNDFQLDFSTGIGISGIDSYWFVNSGISFRLNYL